ncbi:MAG: hypothetical protein KTR31_24390, partial [Myxococcales bacterium]|nr:hypothetical protein [Myxococcales bacterium]
LGEYATTLLGGLHDGTVVWSRTLQGTTQAALTRIDHGPDGGVYVGGRGDTLSTFADGRVIGGAGESDAFVARLDTEGDVV